MTFDGSAQIKRNLRGLPDKYYLENPADGKYYDLTDFKSTDDGWVLRDKHGEPMSKSTRMWNKIDGLGAIWIRYIVITFLLTIIFAILGVIIGVLFGSKSGFTRMNFKKYI